MSFETRHGVNWRQLIHAAADFLARMLLVAPKVPRVRRILVRAPRRAEIEQWLRSRN